MCALLDSSPSPEEFENKYFLTFEEPSNAYSILTGLIISAPFSPHSTIDMSNALVASVSIVDSVNCRLGDETNSSHWHDFVQTSFRR